MRLAGRVALVTGAAGGIGEATARRFAREGAILAVNDVDLELVRPSLASEDAAFITGQVLFVDGGMSVGV